MTESRSLLASGAAWFAARPLAALGVSLVVVALSVLGVLRIDLAGSLSDMIGSDSPSSRALVRIGEEYHTSDELLVLATLDAGVSGEGAERLEEFGESLARAIAADPAASGMVASVRHRQDDAFARWAREFVLPSLPYYMSEPGFEEFMDRLTRDGMDRQLSRAEAMLSTPGAATGPILEQTLRDPLRLAELVDRSALTSDGGRPVAGLDPDATPPPLLSADGRTLMVRIAGVRQVNDLPFARALTDRVAMLVERVGHEGLTVELAGGYAIATTTSRGIRRDLSRSILVAVVLVHALFFVLYRHPLAPFVVGASAALGILAGFGVQSVGGAVITPLSASIGAMLAGLGVDYGVHLLSHYQAERPGAAGTVEASRRSVRLVGGAILASGLTTAIGFGSMAFSGVTMLRGFAYIGVACLLGCLASVLLLMPASFRLVDRVRSARTARLSWVGGAVSRRWRGCLLAGLTLIGVQVAIVGAMGWAPPVETDLSTMHPRPNRALELTESLASRFEGAGEWLPLEVQGADARTMLANAHRIDRALTGEEGRAVGVARTFGVHTLIPDPDRSGRRFERLRSLDPERVRGDFDNVIAGSVFGDDAFAEYGVTVSELVRARPPTVSELRAFPTIASRVLPDREADAPDASTEPEPGIAVPDRELPRAPDQEARSLLVVQMGGSLADRDARDAAIEGIRRLIEPIPGATLSGVTTVAYDLERATRGDLARLALTAGGLIVACLLVILRRPTLVALALIPMATGALAMLTAMLLTGLRLNALNGAAVPLLLGITVDAGVILVAYWKGRSGDRSRAFGSCVQAVLAASLTTLVGFGAVCLSTTPAIRSLGMLTCFGVLGSTLGTLLVLVPILTHLSARTDTLDRAGSG